MKHRRNFIVDAAVNSTITFDRVIVHSNPSVYGFVGWRKNKSEGDSSKKITVGNKNETYYAVFKEKPIGLKVVDITTQEKHHDYRVDLLEEAFGTEFRGTNCVCSQIRYGNGVNISIKDLKDDSIIEAKIVDTNFQKITKKEWEVIYRNKRFDFTELNKNTVLYNGGFEDESRIRIFRFRRDGDSTKRIEYNEKLTEVFVKSSIKGQVVPFDISIKAEGDWIKVEKTNEFVDGDVQKILIKTKENDTEFERQAYISFTQKGSATDEAKTIMMSFNQNYNNIPYKIPYEANIRGTFLPNTFIVTFTNDHSFEIKFDGSNRNITGEIVFYGGALKNSEFVLKKIELKENSSFTTNLVCTQTPNPFRYDVDKKISFNIVNDLTP